MLWAISAWATITGVMSTIAIWVFCALAALLASGCTADRERVPGEPVPISMWMFGGVEEQDRWLRQAVNRFNTAQDDIRVDYENRDWATQRESLITSTIAGEGPDIIRVHHKYSVEFGELGGLYALERFADFPQVKARILDNLWEHVAYEDQHFGLPIQILPFIMAVNKELLAAHEVEVPQTWEDMLALGPVLKEQGLFAFTMPAGLNQDTAYRFLPLLYKAGGRVFNEDWTRAAFNGPAGISALEFLVAMKEQGFMPPACAAYAFDENAATWCTEKALLSIEGPWWQHIASNNYDFPVEEKLRLIRLPGPAQPLGPHPPRTLLDLVMVAITGYTRAPEEAWTVIKALWLDDPQWHVPNAEMLGFPTQKIAYAPEIESNFINAEVLAAAGQNGLAWPGHPAVTQIQRLMADAVNMSLSGTMSPKEALDQAAAEVDEILADY
ncbi:MAG: extracellular solute-binding protein [Gemmatimonadota bacterium]|nr:extracellular solute-binding protein [Gemmatimonadota bacterium]